jgi:hypothetical protein
MDLTIQLLATEAAKTNSLLASIAAHLAFGFIVLFYGIQKFFEEVEKKLSADTKLEISVWLLDAHPTQSIKALYFTFPRIFNRIFGEKHLSWKCFWRSWIASCAMSLIVIIGETLFRGLYPLQLKGIRHLAAFTVGALVGNILPDYLSLWKTRYLLNLSVLKGNLCFNIYSLLADILLSIPFAICGLAMTMVFGYLTLGLLPDYDATYSISSYFRMPDRTSFAYKENTLLSVSTVAVALIPALFARLWLILYVASGLTLTAARNLDMGFAWFNRRFDIENHPLQCIGLVAGAISALGYWLLAAVHLVP